MGGTDDFISRSDLMVRSAECLDNCKLVIFSRFGHGIDIFEEMAEEACRFFNNWKETGYYYEPVINDGSPVFFHLDVKGQFFLIIDQFSRIALLYWVLHNGSNKRNSVVK